jgi:hypothetical protein
MNQYLPPNLGTRIQAEGMRINAQSKHGRRQHGKRASAKARWSLFLGLIAAVVALLIWVAG